MYYSIMARIRIDGKHHSRAGFIGPCHLHHYNSNRAIKRVHPVLYVVTNRSLGEHTRDTAAPFLYDVLVTTNIEI